MTPTEHLLERISERNIELSSVYRAISQGKKSKSKDYGAQTRFYYKGITVITHNKLKTIITAYYADT